MGFFDRALSFGIPPCAMGGQLEMNPPAAKLGMGREAEMVVMVAAWFFFGSLFKTIEMTPSFFVAWVLLSSLLSMIMLSAIGYFDHPIPMPELSSVVSLLFALPISALVSKWLLMLTSHIPDIRYTEALRASVWVA